MNHYSGNSGPLPERWVGCPPNGDFLIASKFMAMKTPLSHNFDCKLPPESRYPPRKLFKLARENNVKFVLWIDLTNTDRYYYKEDVENEGCKYIKLKCKGYGETPSMETTQLFISLVHKYIITYPHGCIAVHCTHGFNRTGFLIISFLIEKLQFNIRDAMGAFAESRPPGIYKDEYIRELFRRYGNVEEAPPAPMMPQWCIEDEHWRRNRNR